jgi:AcrR family transcriptional regulator
MDQKQEHIIVESMKLFMKLGVRNISMDDIARELGISKKTLYQYVENKQDLLEMAFGYMIEKDGSRCIEGDIEKMNAIDILLAVSRAVSKEMKEINPINAYELQKYYPAIYKEFVNKKRDQVFEQVKQNFAQGIAEGIYCNDVDIDLVARLYIKKLVDVHDPEFLASIDFSFEKVFQVMFDNHIRGIANQTGLEYYEKQIRNTDFGS